MPRFAVILLAAVVAVASRSNLCCAWVVPTSTRPSSTLLTSSSARRSAADNNVSPRKLVVRETTNDSRQSTPRFQRQSLAAAGASDDTDNTSVQPKLCSWQSQWNRALTTCFATAALWTFAPNLVVDMPSPPSGAYTSVPQLHLQTPAAFAKEMASGSGSRVNKDAESLLRYGLPIQNKEVRKLQAVLEDIKIDISTKRKSAALDKVKKAKSLITSDASKYTPSCRDATMCVNILNQMASELDPLSAALKDSIKSFQGSEQERTALDKAYAAQRQVVDSLTLLEEQMVPAGYRTPVPDAYSDLPQLAGRATVEMTLVKPDKSTYDVAGATFKEAKLVMVIDGYASPVTSGNFIDLVQKGYYDKMPIQRSDGFVVQTGDPEGEAEGYVGPGSKSVGQGKHGERLIPLEIFVKGDKGPIYETTIEDDGRGGQATVLPFSSYGAMGWAREEYDVNSGGSQFFWLLFDSDLTPAGKNVLDGRYPCFGYVVEGADFLSDVDEGDIIVSAKVTKGGENLLLPSASK